MCRSTTYLPSGSGSAAHGTNHKAPSGTISQRADKSFQVNGSHTYSTSGSKSISIDVSDSTPVSDVPGSKISATTTATISQATNQGFVTKLYHDLLGRDPDPQGLDYFSTILDRNLVNRFQVTLAIETSIEGRMDQIQNLDRSLLGRNATQAEIDAGLVYFGNGGQLSNLRIGLVILSIAAMVLGGAADEGWG